MKSSLLLGLGFTLLVGSSAFGQLNVPVSDVSLAYPETPTLKMRLGLSTVIAQPSPFVIGGAFSDSALWLCMDPLQTIYTEDSHKPFDAQLTYGSDNPADFDKWSFLAPGLTSARLQNLADLFATYTPTRDDMLVGAALQLAVPEIANELNYFPYSLDSGAFKAWGGNDTAHSIEELAQSMLESLDDAGIAGRGKISSLRFLIDGSYGRKQMQDLVGYVAEMKFIPVPEPATTALFALAMIVPLICLRLKRRYASTLGLRR